MTGSLLVLIITPIVALSLLACWLGMVFWADAHPDWKTRAVQGPELTAAGFVPTATEPGKRESGELAPPPSGQQAA